MTRPVLVLLGFAALALLIAIAVAVQGPRVEARLAADAALALGRAGVAVPSVRVSGRDVSLGGTAASVADRVQAAEAVGRVAGVRVVRDHMRTAAARAPAFTLLSRGDTLVAGGQVLTGALRVALGDSLAAAFPGRTVRNEITLSPSASARWAPAVMALVPLLPRLSAPGVSVENRTVVLSGQVPTADEKARLDAEAARAVAAPYSFRSAVTVGAAAGDMRIRVAEPDTTGAQASDAQASDEQVAASGDARLGAAEEALREALGGTPIGFESGTQRLTAESRTRLDRVAAVFERFPSVAADLTGHTDDDGDARGNRRLSVQRAEATRDYLASKGIDAARFSVGGRGEAEPVATNRTEAGRARNRRVVFSLRPL